ncbi:MAG: ornithine carbamoyltransferase [Gammaproteobacteria bacterium]|nr:ornithine carbamoyltransferase [Gammaproteobacteria bacterium]
MTTQHFLTLDDLPKSVLQEVISRAIDLKAMNRNGTLLEPLRNKSLALIFSKSSTRTRVSFEVGMRQLGGSCINLNPNDTQIGRGEPIEDTARVISSMVDGVMIRTDAHQQLQKFAEYSSVPVINGLTDEYHPCQLLADLQTIQELRGGYQGCTVAWVGDGNNVCHSFMNAARIFDFSLHVATPKGFSPALQIIEKNHTAVRLTDNPQEAVEQADVVVTDTWASMGQENEMAERSRAFAGFCVNDALMSLAKPDAIFLHCLPAYRGCEVSNTVIEGPQSAVFQEAENRLHAQKALLEYLLGRPAEFDSPPA